MPKFYLEKVCYELPILDSYNVYFSKQLFLIKIGKCEIIRKKALTGIICMTHYDTRGQSPSVTKKGPAARRQSREAD